MKTLLHVVGARPNFMKVAPIYRAIAQRGMLRQRLVHTGQHYDQQMSGIFLRELGLPAPDIELNVGSGSHGEQTARVLLELEKVLLENRPHLVSVVGDVNSTLAAALAASKIQIKLAHVEAGLRSFDRSMPEEINRLVVDRLADYLLTPSPDADQNLRREGVGDEQIHRVGNVMIDTLLWSLPAAKTLAVPTRLNLGGPYVVCTLHRPANVDQPAVLGNLVEALEQVAGMAPVIFPVHPRTRARLEAAGLVCTAIRMIEPLGYLEFLSLTSGAALILTDSGGLQEETTALGIPCLTLRSNTERPITVIEGSNTLVGVDPVRIVDEAQKVLRGQGKHGRVPALWDGRTAIRIAELYEKII